MSKKILTVVVPVAAVVAFMAVPSLAQATQVQCGASECAKGTAIQAQSSNFVITTQPEGEEESATFICTNDEFSGTVTTNQGETVESSITKDAGTGCSVNGMPDDYLTNASAAAPWKLRIEQPDAGGKVTAHLDPAAGKVAEYTLQVQEFGFSIATCRYSTPALNLVGTAQSDTLKLEGNTQFKLQERKGILFIVCGPLNAAADISGTFQLETSAHAAVVVHM